MTTLEDWKNVDYRIHNEGFHYAFKYYSNFEEIEDETFHKLRLNYLESAKLLEDYVNNKIDELK